MRNRNLIRRGAAVLAAVLSSGFTFIHAAQQGEQPDPTSVELFDLGKEAMGVSRNKEAIRLFTEAVDAEGESSADPELFYWLGKAYWNRDQGQKSIEAYRSAITLDAENESMWSLYALENLAEVYTRTDHAIEARETYRQALSRETRPEWTERIHDQIAELNLALGEYEVDEQSVFNERGELIGGIGTGQMRTNRNFEIARQTNDPVKEEQYYRLAIETDPSMYQSYFNLGLALVHQGKYLEAIPWLKQSDAVWKADPSVNPSGTADKIDAYAFLGLCYFELGDLDKSAQHMDIAAQSPQYYLGVLFAQRLHITQGHAEPALRQLESMLHGNPEHSETLHAAAEACIALGRFAEARDYFNAAIASVPDDHPWLVRERDRWIQERQEIEDDHTSDQTPH